MLFAFNSDRNVLILSPSPFGCNSDGEDLDREFVSSLSTSVRIDCNLLSCLKSSFKNFILKLLLFTIAGSLTTILGNFEYKFGVLPDFSFL